MNITAFDILNTMFEPNEMVCFRVFDDKKRGVFPGMKLECLCGQYPSFEHTLREQNSKDYGIFYVVNYGGQTDSSIQRCNAQFVEMDEGSFDEQQKKIDAFPLPPSIIIKTQKSLHTYWLLDSSAKIENFRSIQSLLVKHFKGDPMCVNESRVMRLPGFNHCKKEPVEVTCVLFRPERRYTQEQLLEALPNNQQNEKVPMQKGAEKGLEMVLDGCEFIKHCKENASTLSEHDWYAMISNLALFEGGVDEIHNLSKAYPGYDPNETQRKINHFFDSGTKPMNCTTIAEKGFKCPKLESGECTCKSPASLCYEPIDTDALLEMVDELPITNKVMFDVKTAQNFIDRWLFNQDEVTALTIINSALKDHFKFRSEYIRPLCQYYKKCAKHYDVSSGARKTGEDMGLPPWYSVSKAGLKFMPGILAEHLAKKANVFYAAEEHYIYKDGIYEKMSDMQAERITQEHMLPSETKMSQIVDAESQWCLLVQKNIRELNPNPYIINVKNGLYNVLEGKLEPHTPDYYSTVQLGVRYDPDADCPRFKKFLEDCMGSDMEQVKLIQEMLGYFLIPVNYAQKCFLIVGVAGAGKSVLLRVLNEILLGRQNVSNVSWQSLNERFKTAELFGKLANIFADLPTKNIDDNGIFKALVGEDFLTVEKKNKNPFSFQSYARLLFSCNSIPKNYGDRSEGFYRRLIILRFSNSVPPEKRDPNLLDKFRAEADGIFAFALEGLKELMNNNFKFSETDVNREELQQYREDSDSVLSFVNEYCEIVPNSNEAVGSTELFNAYKKYCEECGLRPFSQRMFVQQITAEFESVTKAADKLGKRRVLRGIKLNELF